MGFKCGILGLSNVGKSTLFNALTATAAAQASNYPFSTIEPNVGEVMVPDPRLDVLAKLAKSARIKPTRLTFVDIAGLVSGASKGEGLGNQFLAHIREVDAIAHVVRCFVDPNVAHVSGAIDPIADIETIETELMLADLDSLERRVEALEKRARGTDRDAKEAKETLALVERALVLLRAGKPARAVERKPEEEKTFRQLGLEPGGDGDRGRILSGGVRSDLGRDLGRPLVDVGDDKHGLRRQRLQQLHRVGGIGRRGYRARRPALLQRLDHLSEPSGLGDRVTVAALGRLRNALEPALGLLEVRVQQLGLDRLDVGERIHPAFGVDHVRVGVHTDHVHDRVGLADVRQKLVAEALAVVRPRDEAGDVMERDRVGNDARGIDRVRHRIESRVADRDDRDVRLDRRERVVRDVRGDAGQRDEQ